MSKVLNAIVIGVGSLGKHHARIYAGHENIKLVAVVDTDPLVRDRTANEWNCKGVTSIEEIEETIDLASIVVPTADHFPIASQLIERGIPILVEKPVTMTVEEGEQLVDLSQKRGVILQVGHIERFNAGVMELGKHLNNPLFIESHRLGPPTPRVKDVGVVLDLMIHDLDLILSLVQSDITAIDAVGVPILTPQEDIANARLRFASNCIANVTVSRVTPERQRKIRFFQQDTYLSLDYLQPDLQIYRKTTKENGSISIQHEQPKLHHHEPLAAEIDSFIQCVLQEQSPIVSGEDGVRALKLAQLITEQVQQVTDQFLQEGEYRDDHPSSHS